MTEHKAVSIGIQAIAEKEKRQAAWSSVVAAIFLTSFKLVIGLLTGSLGILSEAAHSGLDLVAALVTFFAVRLSDVPPDTEHPYGHGKIENFSALVETLLLLITCGWIVYEVIQRLFFKSVEVEANVWAFAVMLTSIIVDITRSRILYRAARKYHSQALEADALHFSTDIWSSTTVIVGLALVWLGGRLGPRWDWLVKADALAAFVVALIVIYVSLQLGNRAVSALLDAAPAGLTERIGTEAGLVSGVEAVQSVRVRQSGASTFVDLTVGVDRSVSLEEAHEIATAVEGHVSALALRGDVVVHVNPVAQIGESLTQTVNAVSGRFGLQTHKIHAHDMQGAYYINLDVEVPADLTLDEAHRRISRLEEELRHELPHIEEINTHIEPLAPRIALDPDPQAKELADLRARILAVIDDVSSLHNCHNIHIWPGPEGYAVVVHCLAEPELPVAEAHDRAEQLKKQLYERLPELHQVLVHVEPDTEQT